MFAFSFTGYDFVCKVEECVGRQVDGVIFNTGKPDERLLDEYRAEKAEFVEIDEHAPCWGDRTTYASDLMDTAGGIVRHDSAKLALLIQKIISQCRK